MDLSQIPSDLLWSGPLPLYIACVLYHMTPALSHIIFIDLDQRSCAHTTIQGRTVHKSWVS